MRRTFYLYVIKLKRSVLQRKRFLEQNPHYARQMDCLYVGKSSLEPTIRFQQHLDGIHSSSIVRKFGKRLLTSKCRKIRASEASALRQERQLAAELREKGYAVWQN